MKESQIMNRGCPLLVVLLLSGSFPVAAHDQQGALLKPGSAKDTYTVVCSEGDPLKTKLVAAVSDLAPKNHRVLRWRSHGMVRRFHRLTPLMPTLSTVFYRDPKGRWELQCGDFKATANRFGEVDDFKFS